MPALLECHDFTAPRQLESQTQSVLVRFGTGVDEEHLVQRQPGKLDQAMRCPFANLHGHGVGLKRYATGLLF